MSYKIIDNDTGKDIIETIINQKEEIERLNNIIKEAKEYIEEKYEILLNDSTKGFLDHDEEIDKERILHILGILDILRGE